MSKTLKKFRVTLLKRVDMQAEVDLWAVDEDAADEAVRARLDAPFGRNGSYADSLVWSGEQEGWIDILDTRVVRGE